MADEGGLTPEHDEELDKLRRAERRDRRRLHRAMVVRTRTRRMLDQWAAEFFDRLYSTLERRSAASIEDIAALLSSIGAELLPAHAQDLELSILRQLELEDELHELRARHEDMLMERGADKRDIASAAHTIRAKESEIRALEAQLSRMNVELARLAERIQSREKQAEFEALKKIEQFREKENRQLREKLEALEREVASLKTGGAAGDGGSDAGRGPTPPPPPPSPPPRT